MSWQSDLRRYMELRKEIAQLESQLCTCGEFHQCNLCAEIEELSIESNRLKDLWADLWACKLWRIAQEGEPVTQLYFGEDVCAQK